VAMEADMIVDIVDIIAGATYSVTAGIVSAASEVITAARKMWFRNVGWKENRERKREDELGWLYHLPMISRSADRRLEKWGLDFETSTRMELSLLSAYPSSSLWNDGLCAKLVI